MFLCLCFLFVIPAAELESRKSKTGKEKTIDGKEKE
jgi:hypothetical protein